MEVKCVSCRKRSFYCIDNKELKRIETYDEDTDIMMAHTKGEVKDCKLKRRR